MSIAAEAADLKVGIAGIERIAEGSEGCAGPLKASMRLVQAS